MMPEVLKAITSVWSWAGPLLLAGLAILCIREAVQLVREIRRWRRRPIEAKRLRSELDRSDLEDAYWMKWR